MKRVFFIFCFSLLYGQTDLDNFLKQEGYQLTPSGTATEEGYITPKQKQIFIEELNKHPWIRKIAEVGFNAGHTSEIFLETIRDSQVTSFDINCHHYTNPASEFMKSKYKNRFIFIEGDSSGSINLFFKDHPEERFDLIYIDGCHLFTSCFHDILNFKQLANEHSLLWIDDSNFSDVKRAIDFAERLQIIEVLKSYSAEDDFGVRAWVEARYVF